MRRLAVRGAAAMVFTSVLGLTVQIVTTAILARMLAPSDFGLVAMVTAFSLLLLNFGLNGFTEAVVQWEELNHSLASNLFWINTSAGVLLTLGFAASGTLMARLYQNPLVTRVAMAVSLTILFMSLSVLHLALLKRAMRFSLFSANEMFSRISSLAITIFLAWKGWGYWSLVVGVVSQAMITCMGAWTLCRWIPSLPRRLPGTASIVKFAMHVYARFSVNYFTGNLDNVLVGWRFEAQALGFYKKAFDLFALPAGVLVSSLTVVAVSALSKLQKDAIQYKRYLLGALAVTAFVGMGLAGEFTLIGEDLIGLLLGPKWGPAGRIFTFFGPGIGVMILYGTNGWIHLSIGRADRWFRWGIVELIVTVLFFIVGLHWGPWGMAMAWTASYWILTIPALWYAGKPIHLDILSVLGAVYKYILASALAGCCSALIIEVTSLLGAGTSAMDAAIRIVKTTVLFAILYLGAIILLYRGCAPLYQVGRLMREMLPFERFSKPSPLSSGPPTPETSEPVAP
jgi:O-antigen/teichoic acid export membrane protein